MARIGARSVIGVGFLFFALLGLAGPPAPAAELLSGGYGSPAPADYVLETATAEGTVSEDVATLRVRVTARSFREEWVEIPLLPAGVAVTDAEVQVGGEETEEAFLRRTERGHALMVKRKGRVSASFTIAARVEEAEGGRSVRLPLVRAMAASSRLVLPAENVRYEVAAVERQRGAEAPRIDAAKEELEGGRTAVTIYGAPAALVRLTWTPQPRLADLEPLVFVTHDANVEVGRGALRVQSELQYDVLQGSVSTLAVTLPEGANLLKVVGKGIRRWDTRQGDEEDGRLTIELAEPIKDSHRLTLITESPIEALPVSLTLPLVRALDVRREKGTLSVVAQKGIKVEPGESEGVTQIDVMELARRRNPQATIQVRRPETAPAPRPALPAADLAFRFLSRPLSVQLRLAEVEPKVSAELSSLVVASRESLRAFTTVDYEIREAGVFQFRLAIPEGVKLLDVDCPNLNTWEIEKGVLSVDLRTKAEGRFALTLESEQPIGEEEGPVALQPLRLLDVDRETGHIAVTVRPGTKVELAAPPSGGAVQVDAAELPPALRPKEAAVELGFRYIRHPFGIRLAIGAVQPEVHVNNRTLLVIEERELRLETDLDVEVRKSGIFELRLNFPADLRLADDIRGPNIEDWRRDEKNEELVIAFQGKVTGKMQFQIRAEKTVEDVGDGIRFPRVVCKNVKKENGFLALRTALAIRMTAPPGSYKGLNPVPVSELPAALRQGEAPGKLALAFKFLKPDWSLEIATEEIKPVVTATVVNRVELSSTLETTLGWVDYEIRHAGTDTFYLRLPAGAVSVTIEGENIKDRRPVDELPPGARAPALPLPSAESAAAPRAEAEAAADAAPDAAEPETPEPPAGPQIWRVMLQKKVEGDYRLDVSFERSMESDTSSLSYEGLQCLQVQREEGYVALAARTNVEVALNEDGLAGVYRIDVQQIPDWQEMPGQTPAIWAFQYMSHPYTLSVDVTKHADVEVITAAAEKAWLETTVGRDGQAITDVFLHMRNNNQQNLRVRLPDGATIWSARVHGRQVALSEEKERGVTLVPLVEAPMNGDPFQVTFRYEQHLGSLGQWSGLDLQAPVLSVPVMRCLWDLYLPKEYDLVRAGGNMTLLSERDATFITRLFRQARQASEVSARAWQQVNRDAPTEQRLRQGEVQARSLDTGAAAQANTYRYSFEKTMALRAGTDEALADQPPVYIDVAAMRSAFRTVVLVLLVIASLVGFVYARRHPVRERLLLFAGLGLLFYVVNTLWEDFYFYPVLVLFVMALLGLLLTLGSLTGGYLGGAWKRWHERRRRRREEAQRRAAALAAAAPAGPSPATGSAPEAAEATAPPAVEESREAERPAATPSPEAAEADSTDDEETTGSDEDEEEKA